MDRLNELRVKIKSLAEEARIIRFEEKKCTGYRRARLREHRISDVRNESRASQIAYACLRGREYDRVEPSSRRDHDWKQVIARAKTIALKFKPALDWHNYDYLQHEQDVKDHKKKVEEYFDGVLQQNMQSVQQEVVRGDAA